MRGGSATSSQDEPVAADDPQSSRPTEPVVESRRENSPERSDDATFADLDAFFAELLDDPAVP
jgi:hypothetical protein